MAAACAGAALLPNPLERVAALAFVEIGVTIFIPPFLCLAPMLLRGSGSMRGAFLVLAAFSLGAAALSLVSRRQPTFTVPGLPNAIGR